VSLCQGRDGNGCLKMMNIGAKGIMDKINDEIGRKKSNA
jgi:hypothetical protein